MRPSAAPVESHAFCYLPLAALV